MIKKHFKLKKKDISYSPRGFEIFTVLTHVHNMVLFFFFSSFFSIFIPYHHYNCSKRLLPFCDSDRSLFIIANRKACFLINPQRKACKSPPQ